MKMRIIRLVLGILIIIDSIIILSALVTSENEKRPGPTQHPLLHSVHSGWISHEQTPASTTENTEQHEFTVAGENGGEKESPHTGNAAGHILVKLTKVLVLAFFCILRPQRRFCEQT